MKNKRLWLSVTLTVLVVVCAMLILSCQRGAQQRRARRADGSYSPAGHPDDGAARYEEV